MILQSKEKQKYLYQEEEKLHDELKEILTHLKESEQNRQITIKDLEKYFDIKITKIEKEENKGIIPKPPLL